MLRKISSALNPRSHPPSLISEDYFACFVNDGIVLFLPRLISTCLDLRISTTLFSRLTHSMAMRWRVNFWQDEVPPICTQKDSCVCDCWYTIAPWTPLPESLPLAAKDEGLANLTKDSCRLEASDDRHDRWPLDGHWWDASGQCHGHLRYRQTQSYYGAVVLISKESYGFKLMIQNE